MAQEWFVKEHKADALKKQKAYTSYRFTDNDDNSFIYWSWSLKDGDFRISTSSSHIFDYNSSDYMQITVGFYDNQDNLIDNGNYRVKVEKDRQFARGSKKSIIKYLNEQEGYVRIIAPLYGTTVNYEIKVLCHKSYNNINQ
jgi:hypothetical protein